MKLTMKRWSWEILPCQDDRQVLEWSKKVIIPKKSRAGLNITHDASRCSAFILRRYRAENIDKKKKKKSHKEATMPSGSWCSCWFSFEQSIVFHAAMPISVIAKCLVIDASSKVFWRSFGGTQSLEAPPGLIYSWTDESQRTCWALK